MEVDEAVDCFAAMPRITHPRQLLKDVSLGYVVVIEHDLDVIAEANWVIDLGPDGGDASGRIVAEDTPQGVVRRGTHTGMALALYLSH